VGGPADYSEHHGGYEHMLGQHRDLAITAEQRLRFVTLLSQAADDAGMPADPEFRAAVLGYADRSRSPVRWAAPPAPSPAA
jgi:hemoglobin